MQISMNLYIQQDGTHYSDADKVTAGEIQGFNDILQGQSGKVEKNAGFLSFSLRKSRPEMLKIFNTISKKTQKKMNKFWFSDI